jgi:hypothetical protein
MGEIVRAALLDARQAYPMAGKIGGTGGAEF